MVPTWGLKDQVTAVFEEPFTLAVKVAPCPPLSDARLGETLTLTALAFPAGASTGPVAFTTREASSVLVPFSAPAMKEVSASMAKIGITDMNKGLIVFRFDPFAINAYRAVAKKR
jgi:hypothetical protein